MNSQKITINRGHVNLVDQLTQILRRQIVTGEYLPGSVLSSLEDLKQETGLHRNTVKQAFKELRNQRLVKYQPRVGCVVRDDAPLKLALILPDDFDQPLAVLNGMNETLSSSGEATLMIYRDTDDFQSRLRKLDAFTGAAIYPDHKAMEQVASLRESGFPLVVIDNFHDNPTSGCFVDSGPYAAAYELTDRLFEQRCDPVAIITPDDLFGRKLAAGCRDAYAKHHTRMSSSHWVWTNVNITASNVTYGLLSGSNPPRSIIYAGPHDAMLGCRVIKEMGKTNIKVACFGEMPGMDLWEPPVITVKRDYRRIGADAARLLLEFRQLPKSQRLALRMGEIRHEKNCK